LNLVILLNLLIGILANTYNNLEGSMKAMYFSEIIKIKEQIKFDETYSGLVNTFAPMNVFVLFVIPCLVFSKSPKKMNQFILHLEFIPVLMFATFMHIGYSLALHPVVYSKCLA
jgi:hypothetical protein